MQFAPQHMSCEFTEHVPGCPPPVVPPSGSFVQLVPLATHFPVPRLQICPPVHCESAVHGPHWLGPPAPQMLPALLGPVQSAFVQQFPGTQAQPAPAPEQSSDAPGAQQTSLLFAMHSPASEHAAETQLPDPPDAAGLQIVPGP
jgi:hypothetical protein